jgi:isopentenyl-diphosphate delta-isomerase
MSPSATTTTVTDIREEAVTGMPTEDVELSSAEGYDDEQIRLMEEVCIVIDENDQPLRPGTKKECIHLSIESH